MPNAICLKWQDPTTHEQREYTGTLPVTIGRARENTVVLSSQAVSRHHARLEIVNSEIAIYDLESTNGVQVKGRAVKRSRLNDGDAFQIGPFHFVVILDEIPKKEISKIVIRWEIEGDPQLRQISTSLPVTIGRTDENTLVLPVEGVSRTHASIEWLDSELVIRDQKSTNGTLLNGQLIEKAPLQPGDTIEIGTCTLSIQIPAPKPRKDQPQNSWDDETTLVDRPKFDPEVTQAVPLPPLGAKFPPPVFEQEELVPIKALEETGLPVEETVYLTVGGGMGSFAWVDQLMILGASPGDVMAIGVESIPYAKLKRMANNSQIADDDRLRSFSDACPDNPWGWPGYAIREAGRALKEGAVARALGICWQLFAEPVFSDAYTPRAGDVFRAMDREAERIGWARIWQYGRVRAIRKTDDGRYVVAYSQTSRERGRVHKLVLCRYLHIAVGYPAVRFLPDLQAYRERTKDFQSVVNAYENHEHLYQQLTEAGGTVLVRGRRIEASRIIQRLAHLRAQNAELRVLHLMRTPKFDGQRYQRTQRKVHHHWEYQTYDWPKAAWGGVLRQQLAQANEEARGQILNDWGGVTTSDRQDWVNTIEQGLSDGWYQIQFGHVERVERDETGKLATIIRGRTTMQPETRLLADYIIDATGIVAMPDAHPLLRDLLAKYALPRNVKDRLDVNPDFELAEMRNGAGRVYAAGMMTLGGRFAPVDSFLGLQYAARRSADALVGLGAPGLRSFTPLRSMRQWFRWARGVQP